jgi:CRISPR-associated protein Csb1
VQAIFPVNDTTAESIRATFVLDVNLIRSFGRKRNGLTLGLCDKRQEFLVALALWKIRKLTASPFRFRSGCHLKATTLRKEVGQEIEIDLDIKEAICCAAFRSGTTVNDNSEPSVITDIFWPRDELYREGQAQSSDYSDDEEQDGEGEAQ